METLGRFPARACTVHCTSCTDVVTFYRYVEPAGSVAEANAPYRAMRDVERIEFKEDFVTYAKGKGIVPLPTLPHEPYVALYLFFSQLWSHVSSFDSVVLVIGC